MKGPNVAVDLTPLLPRHERAMMFDFSVRLRENPHLLSLLSHYAKAGCEDRTVWHDRLMRMEGVEAKELTLLHGELIAFDWIEQNTGHAALGPNGTILSCYRITQHGVRELRRIQGIEVVDEHSEAAEKSRRFPQKKKGKNELPAVATSEQSEQIGSSGMAAVS